MKWIWLFVLVSVLLLLGVAGTGYWYWQRINRAAPVEQSIPEKVVVFPEGWRSEEMALRLAKLGVVSSADQYLKVVQSVSSGIELRTTFNIPAEASLNGFLFPDTYRFLPNADPILVVEKQLADFKGRTSALSLTYEKVILASIVEREAKFDEDRPLIAAVYANRLKKGMALQADPTVQFAKLAAEHAVCTTPVGLISSTCQGVDWWPTVLRSDLQSIKSPFNTYLQLGLPPQPICNPGLASLEAAANPADHDYLYFVSDSDGHAHFATTLAEHNQNVAKYR